MNTVDRQTRAEEEQHGRGKITTKYMDRAIIYTISFVCDFIKVTYLNTRCFHKFLKHEILLAMCIQLAITKNSHLKKMTIKV